MHGRKYQMVIVNHKYACGATDQYVLPGAPKLSFDARFMAHRVECKECSAKVAAMEPKRTASIEQAEVEHDERMLYTAGGF
jgi:hypothetical protein